MLARRKKYWALKARPRYILKNYGISYEEYKEMYEKGCAICGANDSGVKNGELYVDHSHHTGETRGLLCFKCNIMIGCANDSPELLEKAIKYLKYYKYKEIVNAPASD